MRKAIRKLLIAAAATLAFAVYVTAGEAANNELIMDGRALMEASGEMATGFIIGSVQTFTALDLAECPTTIRYGALMMQVWAPAKERPGARAEELVLQSMMELGCRSGRKAPAYLRN